MKNNWKVYRSNPRLGETISKELGITPYFAQVLINRGITKKEEAQDFLFGNLSACHDPFLMKDMDKAVYRIKQAVTNREKILIYGDYDVDGVTSTALLAIVLDRMGGEYETFIPNRLVEGYGMNIRAVAKAREDNVKLIITVDCGINSVKEVDIANKYGIDVVITDHHEVKIGEIPKAYAIVDPHQKECMYPFKFLAGVGVAYKLAKALLPDDEDFVDEQLDLVALGTVADVVPVLGENRLLIKQGLRKLRKAEKPGLKALMDIAGVDPEKVTTRSIGFGLAPRINAMGRVGSANGALELLLSKDYLDSKNLAQTLDDENKNRQAIEKNILKQVMERLKTEPSIENDNVIVLGDDDWHPGVLGIVASRITEEFLKPAILVAFEGDKGKGSGRSVEGFNLFEAINSAGDFLIDFGGHKAACGIKVKKEKFDDFKIELNKNALNYFQDKEETVPDLKIDLKIPFSHVGVKLIDEINMLMPYGSGNHEPVFCTSGIKVKTRPRDIGRNGVKFLGTCGTLTIEAITFKKNLIEIPKQGDMVDLVYAPSINSWNGIDSIQLNIKDLDIVS